MYCRRSHLLWGALLALSIVTVTAQARREAGNVKEAVDKLTADVAAGKTISDKEVEAFVKKWEDLEDVMKAAYKPVKKGPSLEATLNKLAKKRTLTQADKDQLKRIADLSKALSLVTKHYTEKTKGNAAKKKDWDKFTKDMADGSEDLIKALKGKDGKEIGVKATKLAGSCTDCHGIFR